MSIDPHLKVSRTKNKILGDAGEHFALSQFTFAGKPALKVPDGWPGYDLIVETGNCPVSVSVKTRSESERWKSASWFQFDETHVSDWLVFVFLKKTGQTRSWVLPFTVAQKYGNNPGPNRKNAHEREVSWAKLNKEPLKFYENNWSLIEYPPSHA